MITDSLQVIAVLLGVIFISVQFIDRFKWAAKLSPVLWILGLSAVVSNVGLIDKSLPLYGQINSFAVPFAVALILLQVKLSDFRKAGKAIMVAFLVACLGTMLGVLTAGVAVNPLIENILGGDSWKLAGPYTGTYVGGNMNFFALWEGLEVGNSDLFAAASAVDNIMTFLMFVIWLSVPVWLGRHYPVSKFWAIKENGEKKQDEKKKPSFNSTHIVTLVFTAILIVVLSNWIKATFIAPYLPQVPTILVITTLSLILGHTGLFDKMEGGYEMGNLAFYLFFASVGAMMDVVNAVIISPVLFLYVGVVVIIHMIVIYGLGRLFKMDIREITVASCAAKAGPPTVVALCQAKEWKNLVLPGIVVGLMGYALGNYLGFATAYMLKSILGLF
jgi:uncharacterized membrane protein